MCAPVLASRGATVSRTPVRRVSQTETIRSFGWERRGEIHSFMCPEGAISRPSVRRVRQPENIRGHGYSLVMNASCSFQRGNRFSIPRSESPPKRKHSPANHNLYSDEVLGGRPAHTHWRIPSKPLPQSTTEKRWLY